MALLFRATVLMLLSLVLALSLPACLRDQRKSASESAVQDVAFPGLQLRPGKDKNTFTLIGRARNKSEKNSISEIRLQVTMEDVLTTGPATTVAAVPVVLKREIPPRESLDIEEPVIFPPLPQPKGRLEWNYSVMEIQWKQGDVR
ncbi:MAG: hypothetical protein M0042_12625 [Nitrospiraceae bacterium]|nr:hypothetical protein [Nitrospiraceae bacterium]